jgi:hypothetical protein
LDFKYCSTFSSVVANLLATSVILKKGVSGSCIAFPLLAPWLNRENRKGVLSACRPVGLFPAFDFICPLETAQPSFLLRLWQSDLIGVECQDIDNYFLCHDIADTQLCYRSL